MKKWGIILIYAVLILATVVFFACEMIAPWDTPGGPGSSGADWLLWYEWFLMFVIPIVIGEIDLCIDTLYFVAPPSRHRKWDTVFNVGGSVLGLAMIVFSVCMALEIAVFSQLVTEILWLGSVILYLLWRFSNLFIRITTALADRFTRKAK